MKFYDAQRPHSALAGLTPDEAYAGTVRFSKDAITQKKQHDDCVLPVLQSTAIRAQASSSARFTEPL